MQGLFGFGELRDRIEEVMNTAYGGWRQATEPAIFSAVADLDEFLPVELLPLFDTSLLPEEGSEEALLEAVRRYPGFSAVVRRQLPTRSPSIDGEPNQRLENFERLPVRFFWDKTLRGAALEKAFFDQLHGKAIDLVGPWPGNVDPIRRGAMIRELAGWLWDTTVGSGETERRDQVQHFSCHCDADPVNSLRSALTFHDGFDVRIGDLNAHLGDLARADRCANRKREPSRQPLVFLNACRSSLVRPGSSSSFPRLLLDSDAGYGCRGLIGTVARVPDTFAGAFSERFYRYLLSGETLGAALYRTKWDLLIGHHNPLGLLYVLYADPELRVQIPRPELAPEPIEPPEGLGTLAPVAGARAGAGAAGAGSGHRSG